jgi:hypothetical protein
LTALMSNLTGIVITITQIYSGYTYIYAYARAIQISSFFSQGSGWSGEMRKTEANLFIIESLSFDNEQKKTDMKVDSCHKFYPILSSRISPFTFNHSYT